MFETFCLRLAAGMVFALLILPARMVNARFYRIHLLICLGLIAASGMSARDTSADLFWLLLGLSGGAVIVGYGCWRLEATLVGYACLCVTTAALLASLVSLDASNVPTSVPWEVMDHAISAALLGTAMTAMLMGHWYLIATTMSLQPLMRLLAAFVVAVGLRLLVEIAGLTQVGLWQLSSDRLALLWLALRWGAGVAGPLVLAWMAWQAARIRSTQSATGILYVLVIFVFLGELTGQLLHGHLVYQH